MRQSSATSSPEELRRRSFGGELIELSPVGDPHELAGPPKDIQELERAVEIRRDEATEEDTSRVRLLVDDADEELPGIFEALHGVEIHSADLPKASFDEVFFRLVRGSQTTGHNGAAG